MKGSFGILKAFWKLFCNSDSSWGVLSQQQMQQMIEESTVTVLQLLASGQCTQEVEEEEEKFNEHKPSLLTRGSWKHGRYGLIIHWSVGRSNFFS